ncbi:MAG: LamG domain-containing protein, partial [Candidatus Omnitrophica bacterium]|nr:LamG domain-containing protein [Candidatus Omnitrophota bacterium]
MSQPQCGFTHKSTVPVFLLLGFLAAMGQAEAATKYWVGGTAGNFSDANRWALTSGGTDYTTTPGSADVATFDGGGVANCTITADPNVGGIDIKSTYTGTINTNAGLNVTVGASGFAQAGGTFTAPADSLIVQGNFTVTAGTFTHNSGTLHFNRQVCNASGASTIDVPTSLTVASLKLGGGDTCGYASSITYTVASGDTLIATGTLTDQRDSSAGYVVVNGGTVEAQGNVVVGVGANGGSTTVRFTGTANQAITQTAGTKAPTLQVNKSSGVVALASNVNGGNFIMTAGTLDMAGFTLTLSGALNSTGGTILAKGAGKPITAFSLGSSASGSIIYLGDATDGAVTLEDGSYGSLTVDNPGTTFNLSGYTGILKDATITAGSTLDVTTASYNFDFVGSGSQQFVNHGTFVPRAGAVNLSTFSSSSDTAAVTLVGATTFYTLVYATANAKLILPAGSTITVQNTLTLQGTVGQPLYLVSSTPGVAARLTLQAGGTQRLLNLSVKDNDASGGQQLIAYGSNDLGNNTNWSFQALDINSGLVGYWKLDNDATDASGSGNHGTATGVTYVATPPPTSYTNTHAASFDGSSSRIALAGGTNANVSGDITVATWVKPNYTTDGVVLHKDGQYSLILRPYPGLGAYYSYLSWADSSNWSYANFGNQFIALPSTAWTHLAVTKSGGTVTWYTNGTLMGSKAFGGSLTTTTNIMQIGCYASASACTGTYFKGSLDDVRVYNRALLETEIAKLASPQGTGVLTLKDPVTGSPTITNSTSVTASFTALESDATAYVLSNTDGSFGATSAISSTPSFTPGTTWTLSSG